MHTYKSQGGGLFHHNSDMTGQVVIVNALGEETRVPFADIVEFVRARRPRGPVDGAPPAPENRPQFEERRRALPQAKDAVVKSIERLRDQLERDGTQLTPYERQMFDVALNSVRGAR